MTADKTSASHACAHDVPSVRLLDVRIDAVRLGDLIEFVRCAAKCRVKSVVLYVNIHCMNARQRDARYAQILESADLVYCDGTGVRLAARLAGFELPERMTGADWIHDLCRLAVRENLVLYFLGGEAGVSAAAATALRVRYPGLHIAGTLPGFDVGADAIASVNASGADILLVGMGTPTQEKWIEEHASQIDAPVIWAVGALFGFVSGQLPRGPRWMTDHGLEWLCRLTTEPRKLWRRYLLGNPIFLWRVVRRYRLTRVLRLHFH